MKTYLHKGLIKIPIYDGRLLIVLTNSYNKLIELDTGFKDDGDDSVYAFAQEIYHKGMVTWSVVLNLEYMPYPITHGTIAHEASHISHMVLGRAGAQADFDNDEPVTYLTEWVTDEIYKVMKKYNKKVK